MQSRWSLIAILALVALASPARAAEVRFPDAHDPVPQGWKGVVFRLSQDYPTKIPSNEPKPWTAFDFKTQPAEYIAAVFGYVREGNEEVDWVVQDNKVRRWYHAPWMHAGANGREFIRGLTRERTTPRAEVGKGELHPSQTQCFQNWAVSFFNSPGGYQIGRIWADPWHPDATLALFPEGTVAAKLLFTTATVDQVPYLAGSLEWDANIHDLPPDDLDCRDRSRRKTQRVRLLQIDLAVRDVRADTTTGWVFATLSYDGTRSSASVFDRMVPVGLMWGNDPDVTAASHAGGMRPNEGWINPGNTMPQHLGYLGRLNGPVDSPRSSCLSCHGTAQTPVRSPMTPPADATDAEIARWFRNISAGEEFDPRSVSTDYSLQIAMGIQNVREWRQSMGGAFAPPRSAAGSSASLSPLFLGATIPSTSLAFDGSEATTIGGMIEYRVTRGD